MDGAGTPVCPGCGAPRPDRFCSACGEQRVTTHDYSLIHFGETLLEALTHFDFRSLRAVKVLCLRPGRLTREYLDGRRRAYVGPVQLFVIMNILFALAGPNSFRTPLRVQEHDQPFAQTKRAVVAAAIAQRGVTRAEFTASFDAAAGLQSRTWIFLMIPAFALCLAPVYGFRRYLFEHLVVATHFYSFLLVWTLAASVAFGLALSAARVPLDAQGRDYAVSVAILLGLALYLFVALRRVYSDSPVAAVIRSLVLTATVFPIIVAYRFLLFFVTLRAMH